jgi:predicted amidophosphoribosyltransferase
MALTESLKAQALRELTETICAGCGAEKKKGQAFCTKCFFSLDADVRSKLYATFSEGYASNYDDAKMALKAGRK